MNMTHFLEKLAYQPHYQSSFKAKTNQHYNSLDSNSLRWRIGKRTHFADAFATMVTENIQMIFSHEDGAD